MRRLQTQGEGHCTGDRIHAFLEQIFDEAGEAQLIWVTLPCPYMRLSDVQRHLPPEATGYVYQPSRSGGFSATGAVRRFDAGPTERLQQLRTWAHDVFRHTAAASWEGIPATNPTLVGGMAFAGAAEREPDWETFGNGVFVLPRWLYNAEGLLPTLSRAIDPRVESASDVADQIAQVLDILEDLSGTTPPPVDRETDLSLDAVDQQPFEVWSKLIDDIHHAIAHDGFDKLVAARRAEIHRDEPFDALTVFDRLELEYPHCNLFAIRHGEATFVGATPENLFVKKGREIVTHALAGSVLLEGDSAEAAQNAKEHLLRSRKDRQEHDLVVQRIVEALEPKSVRLGHPQIPNVIRVRNIMHLNTPVRALLSDDTHSTELVEALHPTPAVGGLPKWPAVDWIQEHEPGDRGWYTGTLGWFDAADHAEFAVAIRCGVVRGQTASLYAGAGVVADSTADSEYRETALKQQPMLRALGVTV